MQTSIFLKITRQVSENCEGPDTMAGLQEFHSFMAKFVNLWKHGFEANLRIQTKDRKATIIMKVELGQAFLDHPDFVTVRDEQKLVD
jgi:hypothetical protein